MPKFVCAKPSCLIVSTKEIIYGMSTCWKSADDGKERAAMARLFPSLTAMVCYTSTDPLAFCLNSFMCD